VVDDIVEIVGAAHPIMATMPAVRDGHIHVSDLDLAGDDDGRTPALMIEEREGRCTTGRAYGCPENGDRRGRQELSLITKTFQATHCFDHIAFPQRL